MQLKKKEKDSNSLHFLYNTQVGRTLLKPLVNPKLSNAIGNFLDSKNSKFLIRKFINANNINTEEVKKQEFNCFNDYFKRELKDGVRPLEYSNDSFISPCDGLLSIYKIDSDSKFNIKNSTYTISSLLQDENLANEFIDGYCLIFRLCVNHYHRYIFNEEGKIISTKRIDGILHTVRPIAIENTKVFAENSREYAVIESKRIGKYIQMEVGAMLVGRIKNHDIENCIPGMEKGYFEYGGSTIIMLIKKDKIEFDKKVLDTDFSNYELEVKTGEQIAKVIKR